MNVGCWGKQQHETKREALQQVERMRHRGKVAKRYGGLSVYRCKGCGAWHIGSGKLG